MIWLGLMLVSLGWWIWCAAVLTQEALGRGRAWMMVLWMVLGTPAIALFCWTLWAMLT
jgi:hypothetical protein